jgi:hypothetical protein
MFTHLPESFKLHLLNKNKRGWPVVDDLKQVNRLLVKLEEHLPIMANLMPQAAGDAEDRSSESEAPQACRVTAVHYLGDEGGIVCRLDPQAANDRGEILTSITHLSFDRGQPWAQDIAAYKRYRAKRRQGGRA